MPRQEQFRPSFSAKEIAELLSYIPQTSTLYKKVAVFQVKIQVGLVSSSHIKTGIASSNSLVAKLGLSDVGEASENHIANRAAILESLETKAKFAPQLMSDSDRLEYLAQKSLDGTITEEEIAEGKKLELTIHGSNFGMFD